MILGILQARMSSRRLPGKVLEALQGQPMILRQIERIQRAQRLDNLVVATSDAPADTPLADVCTAHGLNVVRGSLNDVLDRFLAVARTYRPQTIVRLTADCPLTDPHLIDRVIERYIETGADYAGNIDPPTWPDGLDVEVFSREALDRTHAEARDPACREHVTLHMHAHPEQFTRVNVSHTTDLSAMRWTVDYPEDLDFVRQVYAGLYPHNPAFTMQDILALLERRPALARINQHRQRNEALQPAQDIHTPGEESG